MSNSVVFFMRSRTALIRSRVKKPRPHFPSVHLRILCHTVVQILHDSHCVLKRKRYFRVTPKHDADGFIL